MTQVFIWKGYGDISVYSIETPEEIQGVLETVYTVCCQNMYGHEVERIQKVYEKNKEHKPLALVKWLIEQVGDGCDSFEYGTGFYDVERKCK